MQIEEARKLLDNLTLELHHRLVAFEGATGLKIRRVQVDRYEVTTMASISREDQLQGIRIEASV
jgi:hypothetical protein